MQLMLTEAEAAGRPPLAPDVMLQFVDPEMIGLTDNV
jgi:hypothetical protein